VDLKDAPHALPLKTTKFVEKVKDLNATDTRVVQIAAHDKKLCKFMTS
jgi:hypothetical protein